MNWSQDFTVKSNARRAARKAGIDPAEVAVFVKSGKKLFRFLLEAGAPKAAAKPKQKATPAPLRGRTSLKAKASKTKAAPKPRAAKKSKAPGKSTESQVKALAATKATGGKFETVATMLRRPGGASMPKVVAVTGWKPHSARARISVDVSKLLAKGEEIQRTRADGVSVYAIVKSKQLDLPISDAA